MTSKLSRAVTTPSNKAIFSFFLFCCIAVHCTPDIQPNESKCIRFVSRLKTIQVFKNHNYQFVRDGYCVVLSKSEAGQISRVRLWYSYSNSTCLVDSFTVDANKKNEVRDTKFIDTLTKDLTLAVEIFKKFQVQNIGGINDNGSYIVFVFVNGRRLIYTTDKNIPDKITNDSYIKIPLKQPCWYLYAPKS
jgi:hypothetical protein